MPLKSSRSLTSFVIFAILSLGSAVLLDFVVQQGNNTLEQKHPEWTGNHAHHDYATNGATMAIKTRQLLAQNKFRPGEWNGYQKITTGALDSFNEIEVDIFLTNHSWVYLWWRPDNGVSRGVRLSASEEAPSEYLHVDNKGRFKSRRPIFDGVLSPGKHRVRILMNAKGVLVEAGSLGAMIPEAPDSGGAWFFSIEGNGAPAGADNLVLRGSKGIIFQEDFRAPVNFLNMAIYFAMLIVLGVFIFLAKRQWRTPTLATVAFMFCLGSWYAFDFYFWSSRYPYHRGADERRHLMAVEKWRDFLTSNLDFKKNPPSPISDLEGRLGFVPRNEVFSTPCQWVTLGKETTAIGFTRYGACWIQNGDFVDWSALRTDYFRIFLIGTSQAVGEGASSYANTYAARLRENIAKHLGRPADLINLSISGGDSTRLKDELLQMKDLTPAVAIISLGANDVSPEILGPNTKIMVQSLMKRGAKVLLVAEPQDSISDQLHNNHQALRDVARTDGGGDRTGFLEAHQLMSKKNLDGLLWVDPSHLTDYGAQQMADIVFSSLVEHHFLP